MAEILASMWKGTKNPRLYVRLTHAEWMWLGQDRERIYHRAEWNVNVPAKTVTVWMVASPTTGIAIKRNQVGKRFYGCIVGAAEGIAPFARQAAVPRQLSAYRVGQGGGERALSVRALEIRLPDEAVGLEKEIKRRSYRKHEPLHNDERAAVPEPVKEIFHPAKEAPPKEDTATTPEAPAEAPAVPRNADPVDDLITSATLFNDAVKTLRAANLASSFHICMVNGIVKVSRTITEELV